MNCAGFRSGMTVDAGFPELLFRDLRRSAFRNIVEKIGVSAKRAMETSGRKTRSCLEQLPHVTKTDRSVEAHFHSLALSSAANIVCQGNVAHVTRTG